MAKDQAPREAAKGGTTILLMALAVVMIAGLMGWLIMSQEEGGATTVAEADTTAAAVAADVGAAEAVSDTAFERDIKSFRGRMIELGPVQYSAGLSPQTFWVELPSGQPFLVKLDSTLVAQGRALPTGGRLAIAGVVQEKDAALVGQWVQQGVLQDENQRMQAEFGSSYIEARRIRPVQ